MKTKFLIISFVMFAVGGWAMTIEEFNQDVDLLAKYVKEGNATGSDEILNSLLKTATDCEFGIYEKRKKNPAYQAPYLKDLPSTLQYETFQRSEEKIRKEYGKTVEAIKECENDIAKKKYFTALKILITGYKTFKSTIDMIKTDYDLIELLQLPDNLSNQIDDYRKDAENIENKFKEITDEKKQLQIVKDYKKKLIDLMHKIYGIENYLTSRERKLTRLAQSIKICNGGIEQLNDYVFLPMPEENQTSADVSRFGDELSKLYQMFDNNKIDIATYLARKKAIHDEINSICSKVSNCEGAENIEKNYFDPCLTKDPNNLNDCIPASSVKDDTQNQYWTVVRKTYDNEWKPIEYTPTSFDYARLNQRAKLKNDFYNDRNKYIEAFKSFLNQIDKSNFLMIDDNDTVRPIELTSIDLSEKTKPLFSTAKPSQCYNDLSDSNSSYYCVGVCSIPFGMYDEEIPDHGPNIYADSLSDSDEGYLTQMANVDDQKYNFVWYKDVSKYFDHIDNMVKKIYNTAMTGYASEPRCTTNLDHCKYALALFERDQILTMNDDIKLLIDDYEKFAKDYRDMVHGDLVDIESNATALIDLYKKILAYKSQGISPRSIGFQLFSSNNNKLKLFFGQKVGSLYFDESYALLHHAVEAIDNAKVTASDLLDRAYDLRQDGYEHYYNPIDDMISFNDKFKKEEIAKEIETLKQYPDFLTDLDYTRTLIRSLLLEIKLGHYDDAYNSAKRLRSQLKSLNAEATQAYASAMDHWEKDIFSKIEPADFLSKNMFMGHYLLDSKYESLMQQVLQYAWPSCQYDYDFEDETFKKYLNYNEMANGFPKATALADEFSSDKYKPIHVPTKYLLKEAWIDPPYLDGPGNVTLHVKFSNAFPMIQIRLHSLYPYDNGNNYAFASAKGYSRLNGDPASRDGATVMGNANGEYAMVFSLKKDPIPLIAENTGELIDNLSVNEIDISMFEPSEQISGRHYDGDECNAVMFHIRNLKDDDANHDKISDSWEAEYNITDPMGDDDGDGLNNLQEFMAGSDPKTKDSDGDGLDDAIEVKAGLNPSDRYDLEKDNDGDGLSNYYELTHHFDPNSADSPKNRVYLKLVDVNESNVTVAVIIKNHDLLQDIAIQIAIPENFEMLHWIEKDENVTSNDSGLIISNLTGGEHTLAQIVLQKKSPYENKLNITLEPENDKIIFVPSVITIPTDMQKVTLKLEKGWNILGNPFEKDLNLTQIENGFIWVYRDKKWYAYAPKHEKLLDRLGIEKTETVHTDEGFWYLGDDDEEQLDLYGHKEKKSLFDRCPKGWSMRAYNANTYVSALSWICPNLKVIWQWKDRNWYGFSKDESILNEIKEKYQLIQKPFLSHEASWMLVQ